MVEGPVQTLQRRGKVIKNTPSEAITEGRDIGRHRVT